jgi:predicted MFS family arabinose efflux permease
MEGDYRFRRARVISFLVFIVSLAMLGLAQNNPILLVCDFFIWGVLGRANEYRKGFLR